jgi:hypothetical protein
MSRMIFEKIQLLWVLNSSTHNPFLTDRCKWEIVVSMLWGAKPMGRSQFQEHNEITAAYQLNHLVKIHGHGVMMEVYCQSFFH